MDDKAILRRLERTGYYEPSAYTLGSISSKMSASQKLELIATSAEQFLGEMESHAHVSSGCFNTTITISAGYQEPQMRLSHKFLKIVSEIPSIQIKDKEGFDYSFKNPYMATRWWGELTKGNLSVPGRPKLNEILDRAAMAVKKAHDFYMHADFRFHPTCSLP
jgi:Ulp1 family protease